jgi:hypothetical protein
VTSVLTPVAMFLIDTDALTIAPPEASVIVPDKVPPTICEYTGVDSARNKIKTELQIERGIMRKDMLRVMDPPCPVFIENGATSTALGFVADAPSSAAQSSAAHVFTFVYASTEGASARFDALESDAGRSSDGAFVHPSPF